MAVLREVIERKGLFCALYSDRGSPFSLTPKAGEAVDKTRLTQAGRALKELGVQMIPAYSPQARGRMERSYGTWQGRLPQELGLAGITRLEEANDIPARASTWSSRRDRGDGGPVRCVLGAQVQCPGATHGVAHKVRAAVIDIEPR